ncbi:MAG: DUF2508 family protein [Clostridia bacterium]|nr:DUF2508 family protein [Clostridia bacterium]MBR0026074.1 DUF2508 family protein [Clostridia bacterium]
MPRYLWDPEGLPELSYEQEEAELPPALPEKKHRTRPRLRRPLRKRETAVSETGISPAARAGVQEALAAWKDAKHYFETVSDPELVGFAVYEMEAARRKYLFLLKNAHRIE